MMNVILAADENKTGLMTAHETCLLLKLRSPIVLRRHIAGSRAPQWEQIRSEDRSGVRTEIYCSVKIIIQSSVVSDAITGRRSQR